MSEIEYVYISCESVYTISHHKFLFSMQMSSYGERLKEQDIARNCLKHFKISLLSGLINQSNF